MITLWISAGLLVMIALLCVYYFGDNNVVSTKNVKSGVIPGPQPVNAKEGSFPDIKRAGSLPEFLSELHGKFGPIARFWWGPKMAVSIASPELIKEHSKIFDRPTDLYLFLEPLISRNSIEFAKGREGRRRHAAYAECFSDDRIKHYIHVHKELTDELLVKWDLVPEGEHISLKEPCFELAIAAILWGVMGEYFHDKVHVDSIHRAYNCIMEEIGKSWVTNSRVEDSDVFVKELKVMHDMARACLAHRRLHPPSAAEYLLIDAIMELDMSEEATLADIITNIVAGFHTSALLTVWAIIYLGNLQEIQEKVHKEIINVIGQQEVDHENVLMLPYLQQVLYETLRCSVEAPFQSREQEVDGSLGGYHIPAGTPVIHSVGTVYMDPSVYTDPDRFDPDRFKAGSPKLASFKPFGSAGGRKCPGYRFSLVETKIILIELLRRYKVSTVDPQTAMTRKLGFVTQPKDDVWITLEKR